MRLEEALHLRYEERFKARTEALALRKACDERKEMCKKWNDLQDLRRLLPEQKMASFQEEMASLKNEQGAMKQKQDQLAKENLELKQSLLKTADTVDISLSLIAQADANLQRKNTTLDSHVAVIVNKRRAVRVEETESGEVFMSSLLADLGSLVHQHH